MIRKFFNISIKPVIIQQNVYYYQQGLKAEFAAVHINDFANLTSLTQLRTAKTGLWHS